MILLISGLIVTAISWAIAWSTVPVLSEHSFFPLWLGYILTMNGISEIAVGNSLIRRMRFSFLVLFRRLGAVLLRYPPWNMRSERRLIFPPSSRRSSRRPSFSIICLN
jgi:hypothetical protein